MTSSNSARFARRFLGTLASFATTTRLSTSTRFKNTVTSETSRPLVFARLSISAVEIVAGSIVALPARARGLARRGSERRDLGGGTCEARIVDRTTCELRTSPSWAEAPSVEGWSRLSLPRRAAVAIEIPATRRPIAQASIRTARSFSDRRTSHPRRDSEPRSRSAAASKVRLSACPRSASLRIESIWPGVRKRVTARAPDVSSAWPPAFSLRLLPGTIHTVRALEQLCSTTRVLRAEAAANQPWRTLR